MFLTICPYRILKDKQCSHSLNNFKHCKLANLACKKFMYKQKSYHSIFSAINTMMIYSSAHCSWVF